MKPTQSETYDFDAWRNELIELSAPYPVASLLGHDSSGFHADLAKEYNAHHIGSVGYLISKGCHYYLLEGQGRRKVRMNKVATMKEAVDKVTKRFR